MISHIQNQKQSANTNNNRIFPENSPERKSHDNMLLISPHRRHKAVSSAASNTFNKRGTQTTSASSPLLVDVPQ